LPYTPDLPNELANTLAGVYVAQAYNTGFAQRIEEYRMNCVARDSSENVLSERILQSTTQALELLSIHMGRRLGLYAALKRLGAATAPELAAAAGMHVRYAAEWLEQQAVAGFVCTEERRQDRYQRVFWLTNEHANVLCEEEHPAHLGPLTQMVAAAAAVLPEVLEAYKAGRGVPYSWYGDDFRSRQAAINRAAFLNDLPNQWLPAVPDIHALLVEGSGVRVADLGCGEGWSTIGVAEAYPRVEVIGFDSDAASIESARQTAAARRSRARFECCDASGAAQQGPFDLVLLLEALHDMSQPSHILTRVRTALKPGASVVIADERVAEEFEAPGDEIERLMYGWSVVHCLPASMAEQPSEAIGTAIRPAMIESMAEKAGFARFEILPISSTFFRFYRLTV
jgi:2-polyprenyl-3-methyl-5-hydroxy-6-metoxy-1,4-benzoquinol methylase